MRATSTGPLPGWRGPSFLRRGLWPIFRGKKMADSCMAARRLEESGIRIALLRCGEVDLVGKLLEEGRSRSVKERPSQTFAPGDDVY